MESSRTSRQRNINGKVEYSGVFAPEQARLLHSGRIELYGRRWDLPLGTVSPTKDSPWLTHQRTFTIRPRWWKGDRFDMVLWSATLGYMLYNHSGG